MQPALAERQRTAPDPFAEMQTEIDALIGNDLLDIASCGGEGQVGSSIFVGSETPNLVDKDKSPFGADVRLAIDTGEGQTREAFYVLDLRTVKLTQDPESGTYVRQLENGPTINRHVTHLLVNRYFNKDDQPVVGYKGLTPGDTIDIGSAVDHKLSASVMRKRFGLFPVSRTRYARNHTNLTIGRDGDNITVTDIDHRQERNGTWVFTRNEKSRPNRAAAIGRSALAGVAGWWRSGSKGYHGAGPGGQEL